MTSKPARATRADVMALLADRKESPREIAASLRNFTESARILSRDHPRLIDEYPDRWVAVTRGAVRADGETHDEVLAKIDAAGIPRSEVIIRRIEREPRTLIL